MLGSPGASNGDMPIYMLPNVNTLRNRSVQKYLEALLYIDSNGCNESTWRKKPALNKLKYDGKFARSTCATLNS